MVALYQPLGINFDGTNDYLSRGDDLTGNSDTAAFTLSFWFKRNSTGVQQQVYANSGSQVLINFLASDILRIFCQDGVTTRVSADTSAITDTSSWHHLVASFDHPNAHIYVDGSSDLTVNTHVAGNIDWTRADHQIGASVTSFKLDADVADFYLNIGEYVDLSSNLAKFYNSGMSVDLGATGTNPTGNQPIVYLSRRNGASTFASNKGSGGGFTETGELTASATNPPDNGGQDPADIFSFVYRPDNRLKAQKPF